MLLLFILLFMSQAFYSPLIYSFLTFSLIFSSFLFQFPILLICLLPSFRHRTGRGRERDFNLRGKNVVKTIRCNAFTIDIRHVLGFTETKKYIESQTHLSFLILIWHKKSLSRKEILISDSQAKAYYLL